MWFLEHAIMAILVGIVAGVLCVLLLIGRIVALIAIAALCLAVGWCMLVGVFEGLAFLATHSRHAGLTSLGFFFFAAIGFGLFGMAGYVVGAVEAAIAARRQRRAMERVGGVRLERDESFDPAIPSQAIWTDSRPGFYINNHIR